MSQDIINTVDYSARLSVSGNDLNQLVSTAIVAATRGMTVLTTDVAGVPVVPDAATDTKLKRYIWIRQGAASCIPYVWNEAAVSGALLKWEDISTSSIADGSITNAKLAALAVTADKIANGTITSAQIAAGVIPSNLPPSGAAGGDLTGNYPNPTILPGAVVAGAIGALAVTTAKIDSRAVTKEKIEISTGNAASARQVIRTTVAGTANEFTDYVLQRKTTAFATADNSTTVLPYDDTVPTITEGKDIFGQLSITPQKLNSRILVRVSVPLYIGSSIPICIALYQDAGAAAVAASVVYPAAAQLAIVVLEYEYITITNLNTRTFEVRYGPGTAGTLYINGDTTRKFGGTLKAWMEILEVNP